MSIQMIKNAKRNTLIAVGAAIISATALTGAAEAKPKNFHLHISGAGFDPVITGVLVLFVGLAGGVLVYKATTSEKRRGIYLGGGFGLMAISFAYILQITGRL